MKNIDIIKGKKAAILTVALVCFMVACSQGGLREDTTGVLGPQTFYKTKQDFQSGVIPMYRYFSGAFANAQGQLSMYGGDDMTTRPGGNKEQFRNWDQFNYNSTSGWLDDFTYKPYWKTIHVANEILSNLKNASLSQDFKNQIAGQAHFMRGLSYYMLVRQFGGMPLVTSAKSTGNESRSSVLKNYQLIKKDMVFAASNLPKSWPSGTKGRATSGSAKTVLASLYLTWGGWPVKDKSKYAMAAKEAKDVMQSGTYALMPNFANLWKTEYDNNQESIFSIQWDLEANNFGTSLSESWAPVEEKGYVDGEAEIGLFKRIPPGPRKRATFLTTFKKSNGDTVNWKNSQYKHPTYKKWTLAGVSKGGKPHGTSGKNTPLFRYAQVLLIYAEAEDMTNGGPNASAYNAIDKVRERAGLPDSPRGMNQMQFRDSVLAERSYEFAGEYTRWFDEIRTETVKKFTDMRAKGELPILSEPTKRYYISPIPEVDIERDPNLHQYDKGYPTGDQVK